MGGGLGGGVGGVGGRMCACHLHSVDSARQIQSEERAIRGKKGERKPGYKPGQGSEETFKAVGATQYKGVRRNWLGGKPVGI